MFKIKSFYKCNIKTIQSGYCIEFVLFILFYFFYRDWICVTFYNTCILITFSIKKKIEKSHFQRSRPISFIAEKSQLAGLSVTNRRPLTITPRRRRRRRAFLCCSSIRRWWWCGAVWRTLLRRGGGGWSGWDRRGAGGWSGWVRGDRRARVRALRSVRRARVRALRGVRWARVRRSMANRATAVLRAETFPEFASPIGKAFLLADRPTVLLAEASAGESSALRLAHYGLASHWYHLLCINNN